MHGHFSAVYLCTRCYQSVVPVQSNKNKRQKPRLGLCIFDSVCLGICFLLFTSISLRKPRWLQITGITIGCLSQRGNHFPLPPVYLLLVTVPKTNQSSSECGVRENLFTLPLSGGQTQATLTYTLSYLEKLGFPSSPEVISKGFCTKHILLNQTLVCSTGGREHTHGTWLLKWGSTVLKSMPGLWLWSL